MLNSTYVFQWILVNKVNNLKIMQLLYVGGFSLGLHGVVKESFSYTINLLMKTAWDVKEDLPKYISFQAHSPNLLPRQYLLSNN